MELSKKRGESMGAPFSSSRSDTWAFGERLQARMAWASGSTQLEILRALLLGFRGIYSWDSRRAVLAFFGARLSLLE